MYRVGSSETIAEQNKKLILNFIRKNGPVSRADIARCLGMSFPAVSSNIKALIDSNYLYEIGAGDNALGRKSTLITFNSCRGYVIGIDIGRYRIRTSLSNISGDIIESAVTEIDTKKEANEIINQLIQLVDGLLSKSKIDKQKVLCISVGIPGIIDKNTGFIHLAPFINTLSETQIRDNLSRYCNCPVLIESSMKYGAIGEKWKGIGQGYKNIIYLNYSIGLGCALILDGQLYRGATGAAGEIGYMVVDKKNLRIHYNEVGVLESLVSGNYLNNELADNSFDGGIERLIKSYKSDSFSTNLLNKISDYVGIMLINISSLVNPELIILSGGLGKNLGEIFIDKWLTMLKAHIPFVPILKCSELQNNANVLGAIAAALRYINEEVEII